MLCLLKKQTKTNIDKTRKILNDNTKICNKTGRKREAIEIKIAYNSILEEYITVYY